MNGEPGAAVLSIFGQLIDRIKQTIPQRSDGKTATNMLYTQLVLGMPVTFADYGKPWSPVSGKSARETFDPKDGSPKPDVNDHDLHLALEAAFKTALLSRTMLQVTDDGVYREFPLGKHMDFAYGLIIASMTAAEIPPEPPDITKRKQQAMAVLFKDPDNFVQSPKYTHYQDNAMALAEAQADFAVKFAIKELDPQLKQLFPITSKPLLLKVKQARDKLIAEGGPDIELQLDVLGSIGIPASAAAIKKAKETFEAWSLGLSGAVPDDLPYSFILPSNWCDANDPTGFTKLTVDQQQVNMFSHFDTASGSASTWQQQASANSVDGGGTIGFLGFSVSHDSEKSSSSFQNSNGFQFHNAFKNTARGLHIELEYALCTIVRPWFVSDIFYMDGWRCEGMKENSISRGSVEENLNQPLLLPMVPEQMLVVRNVVIRADDWGSDGEVMGEFYASSRGGATSESSATSGMAGVTLGFVNLGGRASAQDSDASGHHEEFSSASGGSHFGTTFNHGELRIQGAQIVAFLCDIVPASPKAAPQPA